MEGYHIHLKQLSGGYWFIYYPSKTDQKRKQLKREGSHSKSLLAGVKVIEVVKDNVAAGQCRSYENAILKK
jgi:hypothetical protein